MSKIGWIAEASRGGGNSHFAGSVPSYPRFGRGLPTPRRTRPPVSCLFLNRRLEKGKCGPAALPAPRGPAGNDSRGRLSHFPGSVDLFRILRHRPTVATATIHVGRRLLQRRDGGGGNQTDRHVVKFR